MAVITIPDENRRIESVPAMKAFMELHGLWYERWDLRELPSKESSQEEILGRFKEEIESLNMRGGFTTADVINLDPSTPGLDEMLHKFSPEHTHSEDEVRFVVHGRGIFHIHPENGPVFAVEMESGDLINVPAGTRHWFNLGAEKSIVTIRLFKDKTGWAPHYVDDSLHLKYALVSGGRKLMLEPTVKCLLLDIEGTTSSIKFVYDVLFPYVRREIGKFLQSRWSDEKTQHAIGLMARDAGFATAEEWFGFASAKSSAIGFADTPESTLKAEVEKLMDQDVKATGLKELQGLIWDVGYREGTLCSHVYSDVPLALKAWNDAGLKTCIYSSGSSAAQRLFFAHTEAGNLGEYLSGYYDTSSGPKREAQSYTNIARDIALPPEAILFLSDVPQELDAASKAGMQVALVSRPGNSLVESEHSTIDSFL